MLFGTPKLPSGLIWSQDGFKYLGVFHGDENFLRQNFEHITEKVKGRLDKWIFLAKTLSYKGHILIRNNLIASSLWHHLASKGPSINVLSKVQTIRVNFFWDNLHWFPQSVLFIPREEGGHGLVRLQSRTVAYHLQFIQRLLTGDTQPNRKDIAYATLQTFGNLGLDKILFWLKVDLMTWSLCSIVISWRYGHTSK